MSEVAIFAPSPVLTVTIEGQPDGPEVHLHTGGQGVWQARMLLRMGVGVTICAVLTGECGRMLKHLFADEGIRVAGVEREGRGSAYVHDRRGGERINIVETDGDPISRHELDELYGITLGAALEADLVILSGPAGEEILPAETYRRLAADLRDAGKRVIADLSGERLAAALQGGVHVLKVSDEELLADRRITENTTPAVIAAMHELAKEGADTVIVSRSEPSLLLMLANGVVHEVTPPKMQVTDASGAGDTLTAAVAGALVGGAEIDEAIILGAASGALNVTRHGLGTGQPETIERLRQLVTVRTLEDVSGPRPEQPETPSLTPDELAGRAEQL